MSETKPTTEHHWRAVSPSFGLLIDPVVVLVLLSVSLFGSEPATSLFGSEPARPVRASPSNARQRSARGAISAKLIRYAQRLLDESDSNGDGCLDEAEWADRLFDRYDRDGDRRLGPDEWDPTRIETYDRNQDGSLDETECRRIWLGQRLPRSGAGDGDAGANIEQLVRAIAKIGGGKAIVLRHSHLGDTAKPLPLLSTTMAPGPRGNGPGFPPNNKGDVAAVPNQAPGLAPGTARRHTKFFVPRSRLPQGLPPWFVFRDADGDGQLTMAEYAPKATPSLLAEFAQYDWNGDGVVTAEEGARGMRPIPGAGRQQAQQAAGREPAQNLAQGAGEKSGEDPGTRPAGEANEPAPEDTQEAAAQAAAARAAEQRRLRLQQKARSKNLLKKRPSNRSTSKSPYQDRSLAPKRPVASDDEHGFVSGPKGRE